MTEVPPSYETRLAALYRHDMAGSDEQEAASFVDGLVADPPAAP